MFDRAFTRGLGGLAEVMEGLGVAAEWVRRFLVTELEMFAQL